MSTDAAQPALGAARPITPRLRPRDAATIILIDRTAPVPKVLMGRRHGGHKFMPGKFVFPGGRVERSDRNILVVRGLDERVETRLQYRLSRPSALKARAFAVAAIREAFEETGLLLGRRTGGPISGSWAAFAEAGIQLDLGGLHFVARAITPPGRVRRFDTRFFAADASLIVHRIDGVVGPDAELVELVWVPIGDTGELDLPAITRAVLRDLEARIAAGFAHEIPVPFYRMLHRRRVRELL